jgi:hypothetical protein
VRRQAKAAFAPLLHAAMQLYALPRRSAMKTLLLNLFSPPSLQQNRQCLLASPRLFSLHPKQESFNISPGVCCRLPSPPPGGEGAGGDSWAPQGCEVFALPPLKLLGTRCGVQPTEMRNRLMISYFGGRGMNPLQVASHLAKARPYAVPLTTLHVRFMRSSVPPGQVLNALLGTVVGLCIGGGGTRGGFQGGPLSVTNAPEACKCVGLGIVRAADPSKQALYIITPVDPSLLENVDTLVRGRHEMCVSMLDWYGGDGAPTPYLAAGSLSGAGSVPMKSRSGIMRKGHAGGGG